MVIDLNDDGCEACKRARQTTWIGDKPPKCPKHSDGGNQTYIDRPLNQSSDECAVEKFFEDNQDRDVASIYCTCPKCSPRLMC